MRATALLTSLLFIVPVKNSGLPPPLAVGITSRNNFTQSKGRDEDLANTILARIIFARSSSLPFDCVKLFREVIPTARGGGRPEFFTGTINSSEVNNAVARITKVISDLVTDSNQFIL